MLTAEEIFGVDYLESLLYIRIIGTAPPCLLDGLWLRLHLSDDSLYWNCAALSIGGVLAASTSVI